MRWKIDDFRPSVHCTIIEFLCLYIQRIVYYYTFIACTAFARFSEAILDYLADEQRVNSCRVQFSQFEGHIFSSFDQLFNVWLLSKEARVS